MLLATADRLSHCDGMSRLTQQTSGEWQPISDPWTIAVLDRTIDEFSDEGWSWDEVAEDGLGQMFYLPLAWEGTSRFLLSASGLYPQGGIAVETSASEHPAAARADLLAELGLDARACLAISEGNAWFARWDPPHNAGQRPATAHPRRRHS